MSNLRVRDLMTKRIYVVGPELPVALVGSLMREKHLRHVPVVSDEGRLVGLVSERDLLRSTMPADEELSFPGRAGLLKPVHAGDIMTRNVEAVEADTDLASAARIMVENKYGCLPVFDGGSLTGIITETDFLRLMSDDEEEDDDDNDDEGEGSDMEEDAKEGDDDEDLEFDDDDEGEDEQEDER
jgi:CBS domain-containing membrane protein